MAIVTHLLCGSLTEFEVELVLFRLGGPIGSCAQSLISVPSPSNSRISRSFRFCALPPYDSKGVRPAVSSRRHAWVRASSPSRLSIRSIRLRITIASASGRAE